MACILHLTDLHLMSDPAGELKDVRTRDVVERMLGDLREGIDSGRWNFDQIVITGDLAHDEQSETYQVLRELLGDWLPRCVMVPGNHDNRQYMREVLPESVAAYDGYIGFSVAVDGWRLIGLDSHVPGEVPGRVSDSQLEWFGQQLAEHAGQPTIVFIHHPPFVVESAWLDEIGVLNADAVWDRVRAASQVKAICAGHVHQEFESELDGVRVFTTPSSALQFKPGSDDFAMDDTPPGFRVFHLAAGRFETEVVRLADP
jgi:Icc protein